MCICACVCVCVECVYEAGGGGACVECVCDIKVLSSHHNGVFDRQENERLCLVTPHSVVNARHSCHSSLYALRQATGLSGIPLLSICPRTPLTMCVSVCVTEEKKFVKQSC